MASPAAPPPSEPAAAASVPSSPPLDAALGELESMGFPAASARIALLLHPGSLAGATSFLLSGDSARWISSGEVLTAMDFDPRLIKLALEKTKGNGEQAME
jgi:hypothetical protein